jgi:isocitrate lyase
MKSVGIFSDVHTEIGQIIVAQVNKDRVAELLQPDKVRLLEIIRKTAPTQTENWEASDELMPSGD